MSGFLLISLQEALMTDTPHSNRSIVFLVLKSYKVRRTGWTDVTRLNLKGWTDWFYWSAREKIFYVRDGVKTKKLVEIGAQMKGG